MSKEKKLIREFEYNEVKYKIVEPSAKLIREAKLKYSIKFTEGIKQGLYVRRSLEKQLRENDSEFFDEYADTRRELTTQMSSTEEELSSSTDPDQLELLAQMLSIYRAQLMQEDQLIASLYENTADQIAEEERISYLAFGMVKNLDGSQIKDSYDDFMDELDSELYETCKYEVLCWQYKLDPEWQSKLPEVVASVKAKKIKDAKEEEKIKKVAKPARKPRKRAAQVKSKNTAVRKPRKSAKVAISPDQV